MKKSNLNWMHTGLVLFICMSLGFLPEIVLAQENENLFIELDLMKVKPGDEGNYVELEQNLWKPIHRERINKGIIVGWILYQVMYTGADDAYNYATITAYSNPKKIENSYQGIEFEKIHPGKDMNKELEKTYTSRTLVQRQLMGRANYAHPEGSMAPGPHKYTVVNYMKTTPGSNFWQLENDVAKPISKELIKNGNWTGWTLWSNIFPGGTDMKSDAVTVDYYEDFSKIGSVNYRKAFEKAHPGKEWSEFAEKVGNSRSMVRTELWKVIDSEFAGQ
jgi:hypothetical protein